MSSAGSELPQRHKSLTKPQPPRHQAFVSKDLKGVLPSPSNTCLFHLCIVLREPPFLTDLNSKRPAHTADFHLQSWQPQWPRGESQDRRSSSRHRTECHLASASQKKTTVMGLGVGGAEELSPSMSSSLGSRKRERKLV